MEKKSSGDEEYAKGLQCLKTGLFQWSKDYVGAAFHFDEAVKAYRASKLWDKAIITLTKNVEVNEKLHDNWACARNIETILTIMMDNLAATSEVSVLKANTQKASVYFKSSDSAQNSIQLYVKVAKFLYREKRAVDDALNLLEAALTDVEDFGQQHLRQDIINIYLSFLVDEGGFDRAVQILQGEIERNKLNPKNPPFITVLSVLALLIVKRETIAAEDFLSKCFSEVNGFIKSRERETCEKLLDTFNEGDQPGFDDICNRPVVNSIFPLNIIKHLKKVKVKQVGVKDQSKEIDAEQLKAEEDDIKKTWL